MKCLQHGDHLKQEELNANLIQGIVRGEERQLLDTNYNTIYGSENTINGNDSSISKYKWSFKYVNVTAQFLLLGFDSSKGQYKNMDFTEKMNAGKPRIGVTRAGFSMRSGSIECCHQKIKHENDTGIIHITLDPQKKTVSMDNDEHKKECIFGKNVDISEYDLQIAIALPITAGESIELVDFRIHHKG